MKYIPFIACLLGYYSLTGQIESRFTEVDSLPWIQVFSDSGTGDWTAGWTIDGVNTSVTNTPEGILLSAGPRNLDNAHHAVLWTRERYQGDIRIEYDYIRTDNSKANAVNIIYIQALGKGNDGYAEDIHLWSDLRREPAMKVYYDNMDTYHISYATDGMPPAPEAGRYVRARRYMPREGKGLQDTALIPDYLQQNLFKPGVKYHITVIKKGQDLWFRAEGPLRSGIFYFDGHSHPPIDEGYVGFRHMYTRSAVYSDIKIFTLPTE